MSERATIVSKQQLSDEFLDGFRACVETPKVEETAVCSETDVHAVWQVLFCLTERNAEEGEEQCGDQDVPCLTPLETVTYCASADLADLHGAGGGW